ncbi:MAG: 3,4-dihydroxy-2-butanone-4-phosphate synthase [Oligoflexales bacterium]
METTEQQEKAIHRVLVAIEAIQSGGMVIMTDDEDRENEGDLIFAASDVCPEKINFMAKEARGLICLTMAPSMIDKLQLPLMGDHSKTRTPMQTAFTVSIEAKEGVTTGISAADRAQTIKVAIDSDSGPQDIVVPGHIFPLKAKVGGVLERTGHTEGSVDLARLAGKKPSSVICEIMKDDGTMARLPDLEEFAQKFKLPIVSIEDLIIFRLLKDTLVEEVGRRPVRTQTGEFEGIWFKNLVDESVHFALLKGTKHSEHCVDVRVHKQKPLSDVFDMEYGPADSDSHRRLVRYSLDMLNEKNHACVLYLMQESPSQALLDKLTRKQSVMDPRLFGLGAQILKSLGINKMRLHVSSERSLKALKGFGLEIESMEVIK